MGYSDFELSDLWHRGIHTDGPMGVVDMVWLFMQRINTLCMFLAVIMIVIMIVSGMGAPVIAVPEGFVNKSRFRMRG